MAVRLYVGSPFSDYPPFGCCRTAPEISEEEGSYASRFYRWLLESSKSCLLLLVDLPGLIDTLEQLLAWRSPLWLSMTWRWRYLTQTDFLNTTSLAWSLALHLLFCFSQEKPLRWKEIHTNTHTHTHTHTLVLVKVPTPIRTSSTSLIKSFSFSSAKKSRGGCTLFISHLSIHKRNDSDNDSLLF